MKKALYRSSETAKGWARRAPKKPKDRRELLYRCGARAFLDPKKMKYPIMGKNAPCVIDCTGVRAAESRAGRYAPRLATKAKKIGRRAGCAWTR